MRTVVSFFRKKNRFEAGFEVSLESGVARRSGNSATCAKAFGPFNSASGVTLVEIMVALVVFGILIAASVPAFRKYMATQQVEGTIHRLAANLRLARQSAAAERNNYKVTFNPTAKRYSMLDDDNNNGVADNGEMVLGPINIPAELTVTNGPALPFPGDTLVFYPNGSTSSTGTMTISNRKHYNRLVRVMRSTGAVAVR